MRDAATVVLHRPGRAGREVFFVRRPQQARAFAGVWAFPGGSVDAADRSPLWRELAPSGWPSWPQEAKTVENGRWEISQERFLAWWPEPFAVDQTPAAAGQDDLWPAIDPDPASHLAVRVAAIRELFEEVGVLLWDAPGLSLPAGNWREAVGAQARRFITLFARYGARPAWPGLRYLGRLTTPPGPPARFQARFFQAQLPPGQTPSIALQGGEIAEGRWMTPDAALEQAEGGRFPLVMPTRYVLGRLLQCPDALA
ncbi:MAG: hypothetical protein M0Z53_13285 [Thermaerobacter sp.]|nr:hypothetical protein [Thermaerobacter sp.]